MNDGKEPVVNREHKDQLFRLLFAEKEDRLSLYNAVNGTDYTNVDDLETRELSNAIYMKMKNDVSFVFQFQLNIYEHQSTPNPNMPIRSLYYLSDLLHGMIEDSKIYLQTPVLIPEPRFVVFYNGSAPYPMQGEYRLTDLYEKPSNDPQIEIKVRVININPGNNPQILQRCEKLYGYSEFIGRIRKGREQGMSLSDAVDWAINKCIRDGILENFLRKNQAEVKQMSIYEYDEERHIQLEREDAMKKGLTQGLLQERAHLASAVKHLMQQMELSAEDALSAMGIPEEEQKILLELISREETASE